MRSVIVTACGVFVAAGGYSGAALAQGLPPGLAGLKMVQPEPERPGDRALSCAQITHEMGLIMQKRNVQQVAATSKRKICSSKKVLDRQVDEKMKQQQAQMPLLAVAGAAPGPAATAILSKVNADTMALEQRQQPDRQQAQANMMSGTGDLIGVFNDPRLMRLGMLAQEHQCAESAPRPPPTQPADACENPDEAHATATVARPPGKESSGPADPFAARGKSAPAAVPPGGADSAAKPDPFARR